MEKIQSLADTNFNVIFNGFNEAFKDYEMQLNKDELRVMLKRRGFNPELSFAAFKEDKIISFTFNAIGSFNGIKTAYDTGTGTIKEYRGQGLASKIFLHSIPFLKEVGVSQYLLEVLQHNTKAVSVYSKVGFEVSREFNHFVQKNDDIRLCPKTMTSDYHLEPVDLNQIKLTTNFYDFNPSWQNSLDAVSRDQKGFKMIGAYRNKELAGFCIFAHASGDITQIAVDKRFRRKGIATNLLKDAIKFNQHDSVQIINVDANCAALNGFLEANSIGLQGKQYEMVKQI